jgi:D-glycero-alpha-D-manno-heptose-7-phosphate kinase
MIFRSIAPLRIGLAGGGTDVSPYSDLYGGAVLNATISLFARASIQWLSEKKIVLEAADRGETASFTTGTELPINGQLDLHKAVYNCVRADFGGFTKGLRLTTSVDVPGGSGLGSSSTLVVAIVGAFREMLRFQLGEYDLAHYAHHIERNYLKWIGGKQDQYAATFGGINFIEFYKDDEVIVNPIRIKPETRLELENNLLLYYTGASRPSAAAIIEEQARNVLDNKSRPVEAMHHLRGQAVMMKKALLKGSVDEMGEILDFGYRQKRKMANGIASPLLDEMYEAAKKAGATGGKISGAGGGGFMIFYCPGNTKYTVTESLQKFTGHCRPFQFAEQGLRTWSI